MSFSLREFLMTGFRDAIGKQADYKIVENSVGWFNKGVLLEDDLNELQNLITAKNEPADALQYIEK